MSETGTSSSLTDPQLVSTGHHKMSQKSGKRRYVQKWLDRLPCFLIRYVFSAEAYLTILTIVFSDLESLLGPHKYDGPDMQLRFRH
jgi:hypothetical protein